MFRLLFSGLSKASIIAGILSLVLSTGYFKYKSTKRKNLRDKINLANELGDANSKAFESKRQEVKAKSLNDLTFNCELTDKQKEELSNEDKHSHFRKCATFK